MHNLAAGHERLDLAIWMVYTDDKAAKYRTVVPEKNRTLQASRGGSNSQDNVT